MVLDIKTLYNKDVCYLGRINNTPASNGNNHIAAVLPGHKSAILNGIDGGVRGYLVIGAYNIYVAAFEPFFDLAYRTCLGQYFICHQYGFAQTERLDDIFELT